jgi:hypothetical protein
LGKQTSLNLIFGLARWTSSLSQAQITRLARESRFLSFNSRASSLMDGLIFYIETYRMDVTLL